MTREDERPGKGTRASSKSFTTDHRNSSPRRRIGNPYCGCQVPGIHEPGCIVLDPVPPQRCSRDYACKAQPLAVLERAYCCPCVEAQQALAGVVA